MRHAKHLNLTAHSRNMNTVIINTKLYEGLSLNIRPNPP